MESSSSSDWAVYLALLLAVFSVLLNALLRRSSRKKLNLPPGPAGWPIIGNLDLMGTLPHRSIHELSRRYGTVMQLRFGSVPVIVGSSVDAAKQILKTMDLTFASRPKTAAGKYTTYNYADITWSPYGPYWRQARKMCATELFSSRRLDEYEYIRVEETAALLRGLSRLAGAGVSIKDLLSTVSLNVISRMVLGKRYLDEKEGAAAGVTPEEFKKMLDELFLLNGVLNIGDYIPWLSFLDLQGSVSV